MPMYLTQKAAAARTPERLEIAAMTLMMMIMIMIVTRVGLMSILKRGNLLMKSFHTKH